MKRCAIPVCAVPLSAPCRPHSSIVMLCMGTLSRQGRKNPLDHYALRNETMRFYVGVKRGNQVSSKHPVQFLLQASFRRAQHSVLRRYFR